MSDDLIEQLVQMADDLDPELRPTLLGAADEIGLLRAALDGVRCALSQEPPHVTSAWMLAHSVLGPSETTDE